jgi:hypothetical protein
MRAKKIPFVVVAFAASLFTAGANAADAPASVVVVDVKPAASRVDAEKLRAAVAASLGAEVVAPDNPHAANAKGTATVDVDPSTHALVVTYAARATPQTRTIAEPTSDEEAVTAAATAIGNLARETPRAPDVAREPTPPSPPTSSIATTQAPAPDAVKVAIDYYAEREERSQLIYGIGATTIGAGVLTTGIVLANNKDLQTEASLGIGLGAALFCTGISALIFKGSYAELSENPEFRNSPAALADAWKRAAAKEHSDRRLAGWFGIGIGTGALATGIVIAADDKLSMGTEARQSWATMLIGIGALDILLGGLSLGTEGPLESGWHAYEASTGRAPTPLSSLTTHVGVGALPGGGAATLSGSF